MSDTTSGQRKRGNDQLDLPGGETEDAARDVADDDDLEGHVSASAAAQDPHTRGTRPSAVGDDRDDVHLRKR